MNFYYKNLHYYAKNTLTGQAGAYVRDADGDLCIIFEGAKYTAKCCEPSHSPQAHALAYHSKQITRCEYNKRRRKRGLEKLT